MNYEKYSEVIIPPEANLKLPTNNNSRYFYNNKIKELVLDIKFTDTTNTFNLKLAEPLIIDSEHDIFLDIVITHGFEAASVDNMGFLLKIDQFNIQTKSATSSTTPNNNINDKILIPNEGDLHKGRKFNYVGTITPSKLMNITGKITNMADPPGSPVPSNSRLIVEFKLVPRK